MRILAALFGLFTGVAIVVAYLRYRRGLRERLERPRLDDRAVEQIIERGVVSLEDSEPLDLDEISRAEDEFWESEGWDAAGEERF